MDKPVEPDEASNLPSIDAKEAPNPFQHVFSEGFAALLEQFGIALLVTTYQAGKLMAVRARGGKVSTLLRTFERPMGLAVHGNQVALGTRNAIWFLRNASDIAPQLAPNNTHDACFVPRQCHVTGDISGHEMGWAGVSANEPAGMPTSALPELWVVNTRFSCLCTLQPDYSFVSRWQPAFVT